MKLIKPPKGITNQFGGVTVSNAYIWVPSDEKERVFEKLRTGKNEVTIKMGMWFDSLEFESEGLTLYDVQVIESFNNDTYRCTVDKFAVHKGFKTRSVKCGY